MTKETQEKWEEFVKSINDPIDYQNYGLLAEHCWLFLTNDRMPERASLSKEAFLHEVKAMIETAVWFNAKEISIGFANFIWGEYEISGTPDNMKWYKEHEYPKVYYTTEELFNIYIKDINK